MISTYDIFYLREIIGAERVTLQNLNSEEYIKNAKILIVDDNSVNVLLLEKMLKMFGYKSIITSTDSREAIELYKNNQPDLLLLDLKMPYLDGFEVLEKLNEIKEDDYLPVIIITAQDDRENKLKALDLGAKDFIGKPFDNAEVMMRIKNLLEMRLLQKQVKINNRQLQNRVKDRTRQLEGLQIELIERLLRAAEFRDDDTGNHVTRIGAYAFELAKAVGFSSEFCDMLMYASMMHDMGKIGIPDSILLKPGKLDPEEWEKMKTHTDKGAEIMAGSSFEVIKLAEQIALCHHERWDGSGYPRGLRGEEIPIGGRVTAICDVFDALLSDRPYKKAWPLEEVIEEIKRSSGTHFDPELVKVFLENINIFIDIKEALN